MVDQTFSHIDAIRGSEEFLVLIELPNITIELRQRR